MVSSWIGNEESIIVEASNSVIMPSFTWTYSCNQLFWQVHVVTFIWSGRGNGPFFHFRSRGHIIGVLRVGLIRGDVFEMGLLGVPSTGVSRGNCLQCLMPTVRYNSKSNKRETRCRQFLSISIHVVKKSLSS